MAEAYIFDLYGTLVDIHTDETKEELWERLALFYGYYGASYDAGEIREAYNRIVLEMLSAQEKRENADGACLEIKLEQVFRRLFLEKGIDVGFPLAVCVGQFFRILSTDYIHLYDGAAELLARLRAKGKKLYLLSNAQRIFTEYELNALDISKYFERVFISSDYPYRKPDPRFFRELLNAAKLDAGNAVMIGNDGTCDIAGAKAVGLRTLYVHSNLSPDEPTPDADYVLPEIDMKQIGEILLFKL